MCDFILIFDEGMKEGQRCMIVIRNFMILLNRQAYKGYSDYKLGSAKKNLPFRLYVMDDEVAAKIYVYCVLR